MCGGPAARQPHQNNFFGNPSLTTLTSIVDAGNCLKYFQLITEDNILDIVVKETNSYADQFFLSNTGTLPTHSRANNWKHLTLPKLKTFLTFL